MVVYSDSNLHPSVIILNTIFRPFQVDKTNEQKISLLLIPSRFSNSTDSLASATSEEYGFNYIFLPLILIATWTISLLTIALVKKFKCCWRNKYLRLGRRPPTTRTTSPLNGKQDQVSSANMSLDLVTIISNDDMWVRGAMEDKVRFEILQMQMRRIRGFFSFLAILGVLISIVAVGSSILLRGTYEGVMHEVHDMGYRLGVAESSIDFIAKQRSYIIQIEREIMNTLGSVELKDCMAGYEELQNAANDLSFSLEVMQEQFDAAQLNETQQMFLHGEVIIFAAEEHFQSFSVPLWILVASITVFDGASFLLLLGTSIAKRNVKKEWHQMVFQNISFPLLLVASTLLLLAVLSLILGGMAVGNFCSFDDNGGNATDSVKSILISNGYGDTLLFDMVEKVTEVR
jgi:hypothetical protein